MTHVTLYLQVTKKKKKKKKRKKEKKKRKKKREKKKEKNLHKSRSEIFFFKGGYYLEVGKSCKAMF